VITNLCDFCHFSAKEIGLFFKSQCQCLQKLAVV
jgi:hypothetical protein